MTKAQFKKICVGQYYGRHLDKEADRLADAAYLKRDRPNGAALQARSDQAQRESKYFRAEELRVSVAL